METTVDVTHDLYRGGGRQTADWGIMRFGFVSPGGSPTEQVERAVQAERAGWDAFFVWEGAYHVDAWSLLAAMAERTTSIRLGTMLTPLPWRRPWTVAAQAATVDQLSEGRVILAVGTGAPETGRAATNEPTDVRIRAELMDEGLRVISTLWSGGRSFEGDHFTLDLAEEPPRELRPFQQPRIPIWVVGAWNRQRSMSRAAAYDGVIPQLLDLDDGDFVATFTEMATWVSSHSKPDGNPVDVIYEGETPADDPSAASERAVRWQERGATWWIESRWGQVAGVADERIAAGPPGITVG